jgi:hypothetical protein
VFQNFSVNICQFLMCNGHCARNRTVLKKQDFFESLPRHLETSYCLSLSRSAVVMVAPFSREFTHKIPSLS